MKVVIAIDSFKGCMSSLEAGNAAREGVLCAKDAQVVVLPMADGGEGTTEALVEGIGGRYEYVEVQGPLGTPVCARYGILPKLQTAVIEMAEAAGITLVPRGELNPWKASTYGVGQMIKDAVQKGCRTFLIGIGGSATTEGGIGMLQALGYEFYDKDGRLLPPELQSLGEIASIDADRALPELAECQFQIACDVTNPLCGKNGAVYVYGPQKGVKPEERELADRYMLHYAEVTAAFTGTDAQCSPGAGAAGGLGFAFCSYFPNAELKPGIDLVSEVAGLEKELSDADLVITGEGRLDEQTVMGKVPVGVARWAKKYGCRVIAFAGGVTEGAAVCNAHGIDAFFSIQQSAVTLEEAMKKENAVKNMRLTVEQVLRILS